MRLQGGAEAVQKLIAAKIPLFEFVIKTTMAEFDLKTAEGRVAAMRAVAPVISNIKDPALRPEYTRTVAGWLGIDEATMRKELSTKTKSGSIPVQTGTPDNATSLAEQIGRAHV